MPRDPLGVACLPADQDHPEQRESGRAQWRSPGADDGWADS